MRHRAAAIIIQNDKIALIERNRSGKHYFVFPGGKVEVYETPVEAAAREVKEELGLEVIPGRMVAEVWYQGAPQYYFLAEIIGGQFGKGKGTEMNSLLDSKKGSYLPMWMPVEEILHRPVLPSLMAELVHRACAEGWPEDPLIIRDTLPDVVP